jgi:ATP-binding cassette subfamily F protein uup
MDKIVDHLFILEVMGGRRFSGNSDFRAYEDSTEVAQKKKTKQKRRKTGNKTTDWKFDFQRAKEYQKIEKKSGFRSSKIALEQLFTDEKRIMTFQKKKNSKISIIRLKKEELV